MYDLATILQFTMSGIGVGCAYGLVGVGFAVIYNATGILNFAQGGFVMLGGMLTFVLLTRLGLPLMAAAALATAAVGALGYCMEVVIVRPMRQRQAPVFMLILATLALQIVMENVTSYAIDSDPHILPPISSVSEPLAIFGALINPQTIWIIAVSLAMVFGLNIFYRRTLLGKAMRACAINPGVARVLGIQVERVTAAAFGLSAILGAVAGILIAPTQYTAFYIGISFAINGFAAAIIGGLGNPIGAFIGGIVLGLLQTGGVVFIDSGYKDVVAFSIILLLLVLRPHGLFGSLVDAD
jgi:branched-chain amino acid transport system permease protein